MCVEPSVAGGGFWAARVAPSLCPVAWAAPGGGGEAQEAAAGPGLTHGRASPLMDERGFRRWARGFMASLPRCLLPEP